MLLGAAALFSTTRGSRARPTMYRRVLVSDRLSPKQSTHPPAPRTMIKNFNLCAARRRPYTATIGELAGCGPQSLRQREVVRWPAETLHQTPAPNISNPWISDSSYLGWKTKGFCYSCYKVWKKSCICSRFINMDLAVSFKTLFWKSPVASRLIIGLYASLMMMIMKTDSRST